jgi:hypothetical protein
MTSRVSPRRAVGSLALGLALLTAGPLAACSPAAHTTPVGSGAPTAHPAPAAHAARGVDAISVDVGAVTRVIPADFFGINYVGFWDSAQGSQASANALNKPQSAPSVSPGESLGTTTTGRSLTIRPPP